MTGFGYRRLVPDKSNGRWCLFASEEEEDEHSRFSADSEFTEVSGCSGYTDNSTVVLDTSRDPISQKFPWCSLAYWEGTRRVGDRFPVIMSSVDIFASLAKGSGLCLQDAFNKNPSPSEHTKKTRKKIGQGILLNLDDATRSVWVYNRTEWPIFVSSPTLDDLPLEATSKICKVLPDFSMKIYDFDKSRAMLCGGGELFERLGPFDPYSVRISFVKGWGPNYHRQDINSCPCWLEVCLSPPTKTTTTSTSSTTSSTLSSSSVS